MTVTAPALYWYQLDVGTLAPNYYNQLNLAVAQLCAVNSVTAPTAPWYNPISGTLVNDWHLQIDTAVRALSTALSVTPPSGSVINLTPGTETANYYASLDACVRLLCAASASGDAPTITSDGGGPTATINVTTGDTAVTTVTATGTATITYSISGGANASLFTIDSSTGVLTFRSASTDGSYAVTVAATNLFGSATQSLTVEVASVAPYTASAVHFDGSTYLTLASIVQAASGPGYAFSVWVKLADLAFNPNLFAVLIPADHTTSFASVVMRTPTASGVSEIGQGCWDATFTDFLAGNSPTGAWTAATWVNVAVSVKTNLSAGNKLQKIVASGTNQTPIGGVSDTDPSFAIDYSTQTLAVPDDPLDASLFIGDMADFQLWLGQYIDWSDAGNLSKIISGGKPVNPSTAATAFGTQTILFSGDSTTFATNQGTGGAFTLTGALTDASTSPSD